LKAEIVRERTLNTLRRKELNRNLSRSDLNISKLDSLTLLIEYWKKEETFYRAQQAGDKQVKATSNRQLSLKATPQCISDIPQMEH
jgi:hypothetical protein